MQKQLILLLFISTQLFSQNNVVTDSVENSVNKQLIGAILNDPETKEDFYIRAEKLIQKGANPNQVMLHTKKVKKLGAMIPIIKDFYRNKYRDVHYKTTPFLEAVSTGDILLVNDMIKLGSNVSFSSEEVPKPIILASLNKDVEMILYLISKGANPENINLFNFTNASTIDFLIDKGANPETINFNFALDDREELEHLIALNPTFKNVRLNFTKIVSDDSLFNFLMEKGMPVNVQGDFPQDCSLLFSAISNANFYIVKELINAGADVNEYCTKGFAETPLIAAIKAEDETIVLYLLDKGAAVTKVDSFGKTPLLLAIEKNNEKIVDALLKKGADVNCDKYFDKTPLQYAIENGSDKMVALLIKAGAAINYTNRWGDTPLSVAVRANDLEKTKLLVKNGADTHQKYKNKTLLQLAKENNADSTLQAYLKSLD